MIPYDKRDGKIWYNNDLVDWQDVKLHVLSHGLHYASCVFEGERVYDGDIFKSLGIEITGSRISGQNFNQLSGEILNDIMI